MQTQVYPLKSFDGAAIVKAAVEAGLERFIVRRGSQERLFCTSKYYDRLVNARLGHLFNLSQGFSEPTADQNCFLYSKTNPDSPYYCLGIAYLTAKELHQRLLDIESGANPQRTNGITVEFP